MKKTGSDGPRLIRRLSGDSREGGDVLGMEFRVVLYSGANADGRRRAYHDPGDA